MDEAEEVMTGTSVGATSGLSFVVVFEEREAREAAGTLGGFKAVNPGFFSLAPPEGILFFTGRTPAASVVEDAEDASEALLAGDTGKFFASPSSLPPSSGSSPIAPPSSDTRSFFSGDRENGPPLELRFTGTVGLFPDEVDDDSTVIVERRRRAIDADRCTLASPAASAASAASASNVASLRSFFLAVDAQSGAKLEISLTSLEISGDAVGPVGQGDPAGECVGEAL